MVSKSGKRIKKGEQKEEKDSLKRVPKSNKKVEIIKKIEKDYQREFLREAISIAVGKSSEQISDLLYNKDHINEFLIAKKLELTINQTRNLLYKISDYGLVSSIRKKDKKKGWYTYFWRINVIRTLEFLKGILNNYIENLENQIKSREEKQFYECKNCKKEFNEENSLHYDFQCTECGRILTLKNNKNILKEYKKELLDIQRKVSKINEEIEIERKREQEKDFRRNKREQNKKAKEKKISAEKARKARKEKKLAEEKKNPKKKKEGTSKKAPSKKTNKKIPPKKKKAEEKKNPKKTQKKSKKVGK